MIVSQSSTTAQPFPVGICMELCDKNRASSQLLPSQFVWPTGDMLAHKTVNIRVSIRWVSLCVFLVDSGSCLWRLLDYLHINAPTVCGNEMMVEHFPSELPVINPQTQSNCGREGSTVPEGKFSPDPILQCWHGWEWATMIDVNAFNAVNGDVLGERDKTEEFVRLL